MTTIAEVIASYIEKRDRKAEMAKRQAEEMAPINDAMALIENWLMHQMNTLGCDSLKADGVGTAFKTTSTSCQMSDPSVFKQFVFKPVTDAIQNLLICSGRPLSEGEVDMILSTIMTMTKWDLVDFRAGKKGITEYIESEKTAVPGVNVNTVATIGIRRA